MNQQYQNKSVVATNDKVTTVRETARFDPSKITSIHSPIEVYEIVEEDEKYEDGHENHQREISAIINHK